MTNRGITLALLVIAAIIAGRFSVPGHGVSWAGTYETFAHLACAFMIGLWWDHRQSRRLLFWLVAVASLFELVMFLLR